MDLTVITYLCYLAMTIPLTVWVARALHHHGQLFLIDVFHGDERLATAVNQLLVIGFYLLNLGYVAASLKTDVQVVTGRQVLELVSSKVGTVSIVLGLVHFGNVWAFNSFRRRAVLRAQGLPPVRPNGFTAVATAWPAPVAAGE
jgi:hypothetical protein